MNRMLKLKGKFNQKSKNPNFGPPRMKTGMTLTSDNVRRIINDLENCKKYWEDITLIKGALLSIEYVDIVSKSRRIQSLLPGNKIVGARFTDDGKRHIITYYLSRESITKTIKYLKEIEEILDSKFNKEITNDDLEIIESIIDFKKTIINKSNFLKSIVDLSNITKIFVSELDKESEDRKIISIYETEKEPKKILEDLGLDIPNDRIRNTTLLLNANEINLLLQKAPYLIAMEVEDISKIPVEISYDDIENIVGVLSDDEYKKIVNSGTNLNDNCSER